MTNVLSVVNSTLLSINFAYYLRDYLITPCMVCCQLHNTPTCIMTREYPLQALCARDTISSSYHRTGVTAQKVTVCKSFQAWILHSFQVVHKLGNELKCPSVESLMNGGEQACTPLGHFSSFPSLYTTWKL